MNIGDRVGTPNGPGKIVLKEEMYLVKHDGIIPYSINPDPTSGYVSDKPDLWYYDEDELKLLSTELSLTDLAKIYA